MWTWILEPMDRDWSTDNYPIHLLEFFITAGGRNGTVGDEAGGRDRRFLESTCWTASRGCLGTSEFLDFWNCWLAAVGCYWHAGLVGDSDGAEGRSWTRRRRNVWFREFIGPLPNPDSLQSLCYLSYSPLAFSLAFSFGLSRWALF